jgi:acetyl esterase
MTRSLDSDQALHPQIAEMVRQSRAQIVDGVAYDALELRYRKAARMAMLGAGPEMAEVRDEMIRNGDVEIGARIYVPNGFRAGVVVYYHGGGWVTGALDDYNVLCRSMADACHAIVVSVDYRLAPENPFPAALEDALAGARWALRSLSESGPFVIAGDSAGGNLAAVCARELTMSDATNIALQVLVCPVLDHDFETGSYEDFGAGFVLSRADMEWYWEQYVPDARVRDDARASPLRAPDLAGLPRSLLVLAGCDPLRDEGLSYATRLAEAGVAVDVCMFSDAVHGFFPLAGQLTRANEAVRAIGAAVSEACGSKVPVTSVGRVGEGLRARFDADGTG